MRKGLLAALTAVIAVTVAVGTAQAADLNPSQVGTSLVTGPLSGTSSTTRPAVPPLAR